MNGTTTTTIPSDVRSRTRIGNKYDAPGDEFIRLAPKTHDFSLVGEHIPDIAHLAADLQAAVDAGWSRRHEIRYSKARVLLLKWQDDDLGVETELEDLSHVFSDLFHYEVDVFHIPSEKPDKALKRRVFDFLEHDGEETLLVLYYAGHARISLQENEAPVWIANRQLNSPSLPSGGIQSTFEEADADVLLLYDCCNSAATAASSSNQRHKGVTEVIAACGYETIAPEVGEHSFSNALAEVLAASSKGKPFSIAELHTKILTRLKCWTPSFVKDENGKRKEDEAGRLLFERQPRRTPIYSIICETNPRRSIILAPLTSDTKQGKASSSTPLGSGEKRSRVSTSSWSPGIPSGSSEPVRKRKRSIDGASEYPQVLLAVRLDKHELDIEAWKECLLRQLPPEAKDIRIEGIFGSFSTLLLLRIPLEIWDLLPENSAYSFVGFVTTPNMMNGESKAADSIEATESNVFNVSQGASSGKAWGNIPYRPQSRETTPTFAFRFNSMSPRDVAFSPPLSPNSSTGSFASSTRSLSPVPESEEPVLESEESEADDLGIDIASIEFNFTIEEIKEGDMENLTGQEIILPSSYSDPEDSDGGAEQKKAHLSSQNFEGKKFANLNDDEDDEEDEAEDLVKEQFLSRMRAKKRRKRASSGSASKRTLSESIGSDTDDEDMQPGTFLEANQPGSSARRLRRKMGGRTSLIFDDPPERIDEIDEPDSCEELVNMDVDIPGGAGGEVTRNLGEELPFYIQEDDSE